MEEQIKNECQGERHWRRLHESAWRRRHVENC